MLTIHDAATKILPQHSSPGHRLIPALGLALVFVLAAFGSMRLEAATLEVMNPRGVIPPPPFHAPSPRVDSLDGKRVGIYWIGKAGGDNFWNAVEELLHARHPAARVVRFEGPFDLGDAKAAELAGQVDTMFYGVGD